MLSSKIILGFDQLTSAGFALGSLLAFFNAKFFVAVVMVL
jgi:hypothetical protein